MQCQHFAQAGYYFHSLKQRIVVNLAKGVFTGVARVRHKSFEADNSGLVQRLQLEATARPFTLCLHCNWPLSPVEKGAVLPLLPEKVAVHYQTFTTCTRCERVFWQGSHWQRMRAMLADHLTEHAA